MRKRLRAINFYLGIVLMGFLAIYFFYSIAKDRSIHDIVYYVENHDYENVARLLDQGADPNSFNKNGVTLLNLATQFDDYRTIYVLLVHGANPNLGNKVFNYLPIHIAVMKDNPYTTTLLLENGANPNSRDREWRTPLHWAALVRDSQTASLLIEYKANPNYLDAFGLTPLDYSMLIKNDSISLLLIESGGINGQELFPSS